MDSLDDVLALNRSGRYRDALHALESAKPAVAGRSSDDVLKVVLLERVGYADEAVTLASSLLRSRQVSGARRSQCEAVLGALLFDKGETDEGITHLHRAVLLAQQAADLRCVFSAKLKLLLILSDRSGPAAGSSVLADVRQIATRLVIPKQQPGSTCSLPKRKRSEDCWRMQNAIRRWHAAYWRLRQTLTSAPLQAIST